MRTVLVILMCVTYALPSMAQERCRQALALGLDVSGSVDSREYRMQIDGLAAALSDPEVRDILLAMPAAPIRLAVYEWSSPLDQIMLVEWRNLSDEATINGIVAKLQSTERSPAEQSTGLGSAMMFGATLLDQQKACWTRTLDISGDGKSNTGPHPKDVPDARFEGMAINALVIGADSLDHGDDRQDQIGELSSYFKAYVLHGPTSFVEVALGFEDYERAMIRKLKRELEGMMLTQQTE